jgi:TPR repeat protein
MIKLDYRKIAVIVLTVLIVTSPKSGGAAQNDQQDIELYRQAAEQGDANAQYNLAMMYFNGQGVARDYEQAAKWFTKAAEQGLAEAQCNLGLMYSEGKGVTQDYLKTFKWYTKAAEQGLAEAQNNLGTIYRTGKGVAPNNEQAVKWFRRAAEQGYAEAQNNLGSMYNNGMGVARDYKQAFHWYTKAAEQGNALAQSNLGQMYDAGNGVVRDHKQAAEWFRKSAEQGNFLGQYNLALMYYNGRGVPKDYVEAYKWATLAANNDKSAAPFKSHLRQYMSSSQIIEAEKKAREFTPSPNIVSSLHKAVEQNDIALVKSLLQKGANVNEPDSLGWIPLHFAAYKGYKQIAELLLNNGAIVDAKANNDIRPIHLAAEQGQTVLVELLLGKGADVNARQIQGWTPLGLAAQNGHLETVKLLLDKGADVNSKSKSGLTPLHTAVSKGHREVVELLLSKGAEVNSKSNNGRTPLHTAAYQNKQEVAKLLLAAGADPKAKDIEGKTPVDFAIDFGNITIAKLLAKTTESHPAGDQLKTSADLPTDGVYSKDAGSGGSYKDSIHGFFEVEPPKGFKIVENRDKTTSILDDGTVVPCSRINFQSDSARIAVVARKTFKGTIEEDLKVVIHNYRSAGAEIITERFITIDGTKGAEVGSIAGGYRLLLVKYKKHGLDHAITMSCSPADFPKHQKEFTDFLRSYHSLKSEQYVKQAEGERPVELLQQDDTKQAIELKKTESIGEAVPATVKGKPEITFEDVVHNFGDIEPGSKNVCEFKFKNTGDSLLKIIEVSKSCGCTPYTLEKMEYEPNESGTLKVEYHASSRPTSVRKTLFVSSNDEAKPKVELVIKAEIVMKVDYRPKKLNLLLNKENAGCPAITLKSRDSLPFSIKGFKAKPIENVITADYNSSVKATEFVLQPKVDVEKLQRGGRIEITITHPENRLITIPFEVLPRFKITPPSVIIYKAGLEKSVTREVWILSNYDEDFEVESTSSREGTMKVLSQEKIDNRYKFELEITPPATMKGRKGFFTDTFFVDIKGRERLKIPCRMFYLRKAEKSPPVTEKSPPATEKPPSTN